LKGYGYKLNITQTNVNILATTATSIPALVQDTAWGQRSFVIVMVLGEKRWLSFCQAARKNGMKTLILKRQRNFCRFACANTTQTF
jgi:hypothetical protein